MDDGRAMLTRAYREIGRRRSLKIAIALLALATPWSRMPALQSGEEQRNLAPGQNMVDAARSSGSDIGQKIVSASANCADCTVDVPRGSYTLAASSSAPRTVVLRFEPGAVVTVPSGVKWTIDSELDIGNHQAFRVLPGGSVTIGKGMTQPEWFGAKGDGVTDDTDALRAAAAALPSNHGVVRLGVGFYLVTGTVDIGSPGEGVRASRHALRGEGPGSVIACKPPGPLTSCIRLTDSSLSSISDLSIQAADNVTYALNITAAGSTEQVNVINVSVFGGVNAVAIGPDTIRDVAEVMMYGVVARHASNAGILLGNGISGNVANIACTGCTSSDNNYGVEMNGANISWFGGATSANRTADFYLRQTNTEPITIESVRSEKSGRFWYTATHTTADGDVSIRDVYVAGFTAGDGNVVYHIASMPILIENSTFRSSPAGITRFLVQNLEAHPTPFTMINVTTDNPAMPGILETMNRDARLVLFSEGDSIRTPAGIIPGSGKVFMHGSVSQGVR